MYNIIYRINDSNIDEVVSSRLDVVMQTTEYAVEIVLELSTHVHLQY